jgi:hypothetical protein
MLPAVGPASRSNASIDMTGIEHDDVPHGLVVSDVCQPAIAAPLQLSLQGPMATFCAFRARVPPRTGAGMAHRLLAVPRPFRDSDKYEVPLSFRHYLGAALRGEELLDAEAGRDIRPWASLPDICRMVLMRRIPKPVPSKCEAATIAADGESFRRWLVDKPTRKLPGFFRSSLGHLLRNELLPGIERSTR